MLTKYFFALVLASVAFVQAAPAGHDLVDRSSFKGLVSASRPGGSRPLVAKPHSHRRDPSNLFKGFVKGAEKALHLREPSGECTSLGSLEHGGHPKREFMDAREPCHNHVHHGPDDHAKREPFGPWDIGKLVHGAEKVEKAVKHKSKREPHDFSSRLPHLENGGHKPKPKRESADAQKPHHLHGSNGHPKPKGKPLANEPSNSRREPAGELMDFEA